MIEADGLLLSWEESGLAQRRSYCEEGVDVVEKHRDTDDIKSGGINVSVQ